MGYTCFDVEEADGVAHLRLCRPDAYNSMVPAFWAELPEIVGALSDSGRVRAVVLSSTGKHFSAGMDLAVFTGGGDAGVEGGSIRETGRQRAALRYNVLHLQQSFSILEQARMPVLAAIQGGCIGGAVDMVTAAHQKPLPMPSIGRPPNCSALPRRSNNQARIPTQANSVIKPAIQPRKPPFHKRCNSARKLSPLSLRTAIPRPSVK